LVKIIFTYYLVGLTLVVRFSNKVLLPLWWFYQVIIGL